MKNPLIPASLCLFALMISACNGLYAQTPVSEKNDQKQITMKTYVIEREIPGAGKLTAADLKSISQTSCKVLDEMGTSIKWKHSYVTGDKVYCVYEAESEALIREHGTKGGFPVTAISEVSGVISPSTAQQ